MIATSATDFTVRDKKLSPVRIISSLGRGLRSFFGSSLLDEYESSEFNLLKVRDTLNSESIFRRVVDKYQEQIWTNGWKLVGMTRDNIEYIQRRFREMSYVSSIPTSELLERVTRQLVTYSNAFIVKVRNKNSSTGLERKAFGKTLQPVAAYFPQPAEYMQIRRDPNTGIIVEYRRADNTEIRWRPEDVIHLTAFKQEGYSFGTPMVAPVLPDIAALRQLEQSTNILVFQHTIPILHFMVGTPDDTGDKEEIDDLNTKIIEMERWGHLVTSNRVKIDIIGANREALDTKNVLDYWKKRVYSGLGVSSVGLGEAETSNRGTATTVIDEFKSTSTHFQRLISMAFEEQIIKELLAEKGLDSSRLTQRQMVHLHIPKIDLDSKIKTETHITFLYEHNAITEDEMRFELGRESITLLEREKMHIQRITIPQVVAKALGVDPDTSKETDTKLLPTNQFGRTTGLKPKNDEAG